MEEREEILTSELVSKAINMVLPAIMAAMESGRVKQNHLHIVVLDPRWIPVPNTAVPSICEYSIGDKREWEHKCDVIAYRKASVSFCHHCSSGEIKHRRPYLYDAFSAPFSDSIWIDGLTVACSGVEGYYDEMFSAWIAAAIRALCIKEMETVILPTGADSIRAAYIKARTK